MANASAVPGRLSARVACCWPYRCCSATVAVAQARTEPIAVRVGPVTAVAWPAQRELAGRSPRRRPPADFPDWEVHPGRLSIIIARNGAALDSIAGGRAPSWGVGFADPGRTPSRSGPMRPIPPHPPPRARASGAPRPRPSAGAALVRRGVCRMGGRRVGPAGWHWSSTSPWPAAPFPSCATLDGSSAGHRAVIGPAYALAMSAVLEAGAPESRRTPDPLIRAPGGGEEFDAAVQATTGLPLTRFEDAWRRAVRSRYTVATWLVAGGAWAWWQRRCWRWHLAPTKGPRPPCRPGRGVADPGAGHRRDGGRRDLRARRTGA